MKRTNDGYWIEFETQVGEVEFRDQNGRHTATVTTDGEFWRVVSVELPGAGLTPDAARQLAKLLNKAAAVAEREEKKLAKQDAMMEEPA